MTVVNGDLKDFFSPIKTYTCECNLTRDCLFYSRNRFCDSINDAAVFISSGEKIEQIFYGNQIHSCQKLGHPGTNAADRCNRERKYSVSCFFSLRDHTRILDHRLKYG